MLSENSKPKPQKIDPQVEVDRIFQKYGLGKLSSPPGLERGPRMSPECFQKFVDGDPSPDKRYLDWMIFQAGGGQRAMDVSYAQWNGHSGSNAAASAKATTSRRWIEFNIAIKFGASQTNTQTSDWKPSPPRDGRPTVACQAGYATYLSDVQKDQTGKVTGYGDFHLGFNGKDVYTGPIEEHPLYGETYAAWMQREPSYFEAFKCGDQGNVANGYFGFYRNWPGDTQRRYEKIVKMIQLWHRGLAHRQAKDRLVAYNRNVHQKVSGYEQQQAIELNIYTGWNKNTIEQPKAAYKNLEDLQRALKPIQKTAADRDLRAETVYEDDILKAIIPYSLRSSVEYGWQKWCISNATEFENAFSMTSPSDPNWSRYVVDGAFVIITFKVPVPSRSYAQKLAVYVPWKEVDKLSRYRHSPNDIDPEEDDDSEIGFSDVINRHSTGHPYSSIHKRFIKGEPAPDENTITVDDRRLFGTLKPENPQGKATPEELMNSLHKALAAAHTWLSKGETRGKVVIDPRDSELRECSDAEVLANALMEEFTELEEGVGAVQREFNARPGEGI
jgi:hypothetical protein